MFVAIFKGTAALVNVLEVFEFRTFSLTKMPAKRAEARKRNLGLDWV